MAQYDLYEVKLRGIIGVGPVTLNVFHYQAQDVISRADYLADAFSHTIVPNICACLVEGIVMENVSVVNLFSSTDFYDMNLTTDNIGERTGQALPPWDALSFTSNRLDRAIRRGHKRFSGVSESDQEGGGIVAGLLTLMGTLATSLGQEIEGEVAFENYKPVIVKRIRYTEDGKIKYRLPKTQEEMQLMNASTWSYATHVHHQGSRKGATG